MIFSSDSATPLPTAASVNDSRDAAFWAAISRFGKFGPKRWMKLIRAFPTMEEVWRASAPQIAGAGIEPALSAEFAAFRARCNPETELEETRSAGISLLALGDANYPKLLTQIFDPPPLLFVRGKMNEPEELTLAVVGTRRITPYGRQVTPEMVAPLARSGLTIVSGLALGVDSLAHETALAAGGRTVAVLGSGIDDASLYPSSNRYLAKKILGAGGAVISEFPIGSIAFKSNFPFRNRVISGLSLGVLVIEAADDSGSLITARSALEQNREVFAVPGDVTRETSAGPNNLIKMGARPVTEANDVLDALSLDRLPEMLEVRAIHPDTKEEAALLPHLSREPIHVDALARTAGLPISTVTASLTLMEMKGKIRSLPGMHYVIAR